MGYVRIYGRSTRWREAKNTTKQLGDVKAKGLAKLILARDEERRAEVEESKDTEDEVGSQ